MSEAPEQTLVVDVKPAPGDQSSTSGTAMTPFVLPAVVAALLAKTVSPAAGLAGLGVGVLVLFVLRKPNTGRFVLRIVEGQLVVARERAKEPVATFALEDLLDVTLDKQTQAATGRGGSATERVHIVFERREADPIFVPDERVTPIEGGEWLGRVRVFLRKHGWVPSDERSS